MLKGITVKLSPSRVQIDLLNQWFGCQRFVWNQFLAMLQERYEANKTLPFPGKYDLMTLLPPLKREFEFLKETEASSLQATVEYLHQAYLRFFKKQAKYPKFKSLRRSRKTVTIKNNRNIKLTKSGLKVPKLGWIKASWSHTMEFTQIKRLTLFRDSTGDYFASLLVECENQAFTRTGKEVGLDFGQTDLVIGSDGNLRIPSKEYKQYEDKIHQWQRKLSRRRRQAVENQVRLDDAKNYQKAKQQVAKYHRKIKNCRQDYLHKVSKQIVKQYDLIALEDLKVKNLTRNPNNKSYLKRNNHKRHNQAWYTLRCMIQYKGEWYGKTVVPVPPHHTSQDCSCCGYRNKELTLKDRVWICPNCKTTLDRDINAAKNILVKAKEMVLNNPSLERALVK